jgi:hypothetical protein
MKLLRLERAEILLSSAALILGVICSISVLYVAVTPQAGRSEFVPVSLGSKQSIDYNVDPTAIHIPGVRLQVVADAIRDQDSAANVAARFAAVQASLLTPVAWLSIPPATRTSTPTRVLPTLTASPTRDPWILIGQTRVGCNSDVIFNPVNALKIKFQMLAGGSNDGHISFNCCGSNGAWWLVDNVWQPGANQSAALNVGESRETADLGGAAVSRAHFNIGCNDNEQMDIQIYYLPSPPRTSTPPLLSIPSTLFTQTPTSPAQIPALTTTPTLSR